MMRNMFRLCLSIFLVVSSYSFALYKPPSQDCIIELTNDSLKGNHQSLELLSGLIENCRKSGSFKKFIQGTICNVKKMKRWSSRSLGAYKSGAGGENCCCPFWFLSWIKKFAKNKIRDETSIELKKKNKSEKMLKHHKNIKKTLKLLTKIKRSI